jgi:transcriptional regulator with XRE-family HTH domain
LAQSDIGTVHIDGAAIGQLVGGFSDYDQLISALRDRIGALGLSYRVLEEIAGLCEGAAGKYLSDVRVKNLSVGSLIQIAEALGVRGVLISDERLLQKYRPMYERRDEGKAHRAASAAKRLGPVTLRRVMSPVAAEMGRRGGEKRRALPPEVRRELARAAARARWKSKRSRPQSQP